MPIYEYACRKCSTRFESRLHYEQRLAPQTCPQCGARESSLCLSAPAMVGATSDAQPSGGGCQAVGGSCGCGRFPN